MPETTDRRAMLAEAFNRSTETEEEPAEAPEVEETPADEPEAPAAEAAPEDGGETEEKPEGERGRDDKGRFTERPAAKPVAEKAPKAPKAATPAKPKPGEAAPVATQPPKAAEPPKGPDIKPPQSWTAQAREAWKDVPPAAKQEIVRLEGETKRVLQENAGLRRQSAEAGQFRQQIETNLRPWEGIFRAEGTDPLSGAMNVVQTYGQLHYGAPQQKAQILLGLIQRFSSFDDINAVAEAVAQGRAPAAAPAPRQAAPPPQAVDPRALIREEFQNIQQAAVMQRAEKDYDSFLAAQPEFLNDVFEDMQTILDAAATRGRNLTYQEAYDRAVKMHDGVQAILAQRAQAAAATQPSATAPTARARAAAATVRSRPTSVSGPAVDPNDRRAMLQQRWNSGG